MTELQFDPMGEDPSTPPEKSVSPGVWVAAAGIAIVVAGGLWLGLRTVRPADPPAGAPAAAAPAPLQPDPGPAAAPSAPAPEPEPGLPTLSESDAFVRFVVAELFGSPELGAWLAGGDELVQNGVRAVVAIAAQRSAHRFLALLPIDGRFTVRPRGSGLVIAPESYRRFDRVVDLFVGFDNAGIVRLLARLDPLISQSMDENAFPGTEFRPTLRLAIEHLLATPLPGDELAVIAGEDAVYRYADSKLEALSRVPEAAPAPGFQQRCARSRQARWPGSRPLDRLSRAAPLPAMTGRVSRTGVLLQTCSMPRPARSGPRPSAASGATATANLSPATRVVAPVATWSMPRRSTATIITPWGSPISASFMPT